PVLEQLHQLGIAHVEDGERGALRKGLPPAVAEIVHHRDPVPALEQRPDRMCPDESRSARHYDVHRLPAIAARPRLVKKQALQRRRPRGTTTRSSRSKNPWTASARRPAGMAPSRISPVSASRIPVRIDCP